ncbi:MAG: sensor histidine kinase [Oscillochloridaceae bacterium umkhey_bin13]
MAHPISAFWRQLDPVNSDVIVGCYTPVTLGQLAQGLSRMVFAAAGGTLLLSQGEQSRAWEDVALRDVAAPVQRLSLPAAPMPGVGFALIGLGNDLGYGLVAIPTDEGAVLDEASRLYDARWSLSPDLVANLFALVAASMAQVQSLPTLRFPRVAETLGIVADTLDFAARQHSMLNVSNKALNDRLRHQEDQTRMIVHDMRAPLHTLLISLRALQRQRFDPEGQRELLEVASESATYLLNLTETMLDSARLETSAWALKRQPLRLHTLVEAVCEPLELAARPDQARLRRLVSEELPPIWADRTLIERVLTNLVTNAIKYTPVQGEISVSARMIHDDHSIEISVSDTGQGIPPEAQAHLFERFYQANESDRRRGTGLGLYFCRLAIEAHGGSIAVQSAVGFGSTFTILLPITSEG